MKVRLRWVVGAGLVLALGGGWVFSSWREDARREELRREILATVAAGEGGGGAGTPVPPGENAAPVYGKAFRTLDRSVLTQPFLAALDGNWESPPAALGTGVAANEKALLLLEVAAGLPGMEATEAEVREWGMGPYELRMVVDARMVLQARSGDTAGALRTAGLLARMVRHLSRAPLHPYFLHADLVLSRAMESLEEGASAPGLAAPDLRAALGDFPSPEEAREAFMRAARMAFGRNLEQNLVALLEPDAEEVARARGWKPASLGDRIEATLRGRALPPGSLLPSVGEVALAWDLSKRFRDLAGERGPEGLRELAAFETEVAAADPADVAFGWFRDAGNQWRQEVLLEARLAATRAALALRLFEIERGAPPDSLDALVPGYLERVPLDPFSGDPVRYERRGPGWRVTCRPPRDFPVPGTPWKTTQIEVERNPHR